MNMELKADSLVVVPARTKQLGEDFRKDFNDEMWLVVDSVKSLGRLITGTGEDVSERRAIVAAWRRLFWGNTKLLCNRRAPLASRMRFWKQLVWGVTDYRFALLRAVKTNAASLETECNKFVSYIVGARPAKPRKHSSSGAIASWAKLS